MYYAYDLSAQDLGEFHVNDRITILYCLLKIYFAKKLLSSVDLYFGPALQQNKFMQFIYMKIPPSSLRAQCSRCINT